MKKILACLCVIALLLCGCSTQSNTNDSSAGNTKVNPTGTYTNVSFSDTNSLYVDFKLQASGKENKKETITITKEEDGYRFQDFLHSGSLRDNGDGTFTATKEKVATTDPLWVGTAEYGMEQYPYTSYLLYGDYLIEQIPISGVSINGKLPSEQEAMTCFISINHLTFSTYTLTLSADGACEIMTIFNGNICTASGTYSVNGKIISLNITEGVFYGEELEGEIEMALYADNNKLYDTVYRRK